MSEEQRRIVLAFLNAIRNGDEVLLFEVLSECAFFEVDPAPVALLVLGLLPSGRGWVPASGSRIDLSSAAMREAVGYFCAVTGARLEAR